MISLAAQPPYSELREGKRDSVSKSIHRRTALLAAVLQPEIFGQFADDGDNVLLDMPARSVVVLVLH